MTSSRVVRYLVNFTIYIFAHKMPQQFRIAAASYVQQTSAFQ